DAYLAAWAIQNRPDRNHNSGVRTVESILAAPSARPAFRALGCINVGLHPQDVPNVTAADLATIDRVLIWLGSAAGLRFVDGCSAEAAQAGRQRRAVDLAQARTRDSDAAKNSTDNDGSQTSAT